MVVNQSPLQEGYSLHWYKIIAVLGHGSFGVTYLAEDLNLDCKVAIKEYMPREFAVREQNENTILPLSKEYESVYQWGLNRFMDEAKTLARFKNPNIVRVYSVFNHNNTAYIVMEYERGEDLGHFFKRGELARENELMSILVPLLDGLQLVHSAGFIHRDIKPSNIYIHDDHSPVLIDFGSARQALGGKTGALTTLVTRGFAPFEQYHEGEKDQGPWSDIYALGATAYLAIAGHKPVDALLRGRSLLTSGTDPYRPAIEVGEKRYSQRFLQAIDNALEFKEANRPQSALEWKQMLLNDSADITTVALAEESEQAKNDSSRHGGEKTLYRDGAQKQDTDKTLYSSEQHFPWRIGIFALLGTALVLIATGFYFKPQLEQRFFLDRAETSQVNVEDTARQKQLEKELSRLLAQADFEISKPDWASTLRIYRQILTLDPHNRRAQQGIERLSQHYMDSALTAMQQGRVTEAEDFLAVVDTIQPNTSQAQEIRNHLAHQKELIRSRQEEQEKQTRLQVEKLRNEIRKQQNEIKAAQSEVSKALEEADAIQARVRAADKYRLALQRRSQGYSLISRANSLQKEAKFDDALEVLKQALATLKQSITGLELAQREAELQQQNEYLTQQQRKEVERSQNSIRNVQDRLLALKSEADAFSAPDYAPEPYQQAQQQARYAEGLVTKAAEHKEAKAYHEALGELDQAMKLFDQANRDLEKARDEAKIIIEEKAKPKPLTRDDLVIVKDLFYDLKQAYEQKDLNKILEISQPPTDKLSLLKQIFEEYQSIEVSISEFSMIAGKNLASATLTLENLVNNYGEHVAPGDSWKKTKITVHKQGDEWGKISW